MSRRHPRCPRSRSQASLRRRRLWPGLSSHGRMTSRRVSVRDGDKETGGGERTSAGIESALRPSCWCPSSFIQFSPTNHPPRWRPCRLTHSNSILDLTAALSQTILRKTDIPTALFNSQLDVSDRHIYNTRLVDDSTVVSNQRASGRCWLCWYFFRQIREAMGAMLLTRHPLFPQLRRPTSAVSISSGLSSFPQTSSSLSPTSTSSVSFLEEPSFCSACGWQAGRTRSGHG